jgi:hypothetical protein
MSQEITLESAEMKALNTEFKGLREKIEAGEYEIEAKQHGKRKSSQMGTLTRYSDNTTLNVTIRPSALNESSPIQSMTFEFKHDIQGSIGCFGGSQNGTVTESFNAVTKSGKTLSYGPEIRDVNDNDAAAGLLNDVRKEGLNKAMIDEMHARENRKPSKPGKHSPRP